MARQLATLAEITREAFRLRVQNNRFLARLDAGEVEVISPAPPEPERDPGPIVRHEDGLWTRWASNYSIGTDQTVTRFDAVLRPEALAWPRHAFDDIDRRQYAAVRWEPQINAVMEQAREQSGHQFSIDMIVTTADLLEGRDLRVGTQLRIRLPEENNRWLSVQDFNPLNSVEESIVRLDARYGYTWLRPDWAVDSGASKRSFELLESWLSESQREEFKQKDAFTVIGSGSGKRYRIRQMFAYGILAVDRYDKPLREYCVVPKGGLALGDIMLAQKIALETDEWRTLKIANSRRPS